MNRANTDRCNCPVKMICVSVLILLHIGLSNGVTSTTGDESSTTGKNISGPFGVQREKELSVPLQNTDIRIGTGSKSRKNTRALVHCNHPIMRTS